MKVKWKQNKRNPVIDNISADNEHFATGQLKENERDKRNERGNGQTRRVENGMEQDVSALGINFHIPMCVSGNGGK